MFPIALKMLFGDRVKYIGILLGIAFTSFLVTFALAYFAGFMTRGFALISENSADVWVMDRASESVEQTVNLPDSVLDRVKSVKGVASASPLLLKNADVLFPNGHVQQFQIIGVDDITLTGVPKIKNNLPSTILRAPDTIIVDEGGTTDKLLTPINKADQWPYAQAHIKVSKRMLTVGDILLINDRRVKVAGVSNAIPRFPPRPLIYTTFSHANEILPIERKNITFVLVNKKANISAKTLARNIEEQTGLKARSKDDFKADTVKWFFINSEDVGDMAAMIYLALIVGFGVTGVMLYMFTNENLRQYAVLKAMGARPKVLIKMVFVQSGICALIGTGLGLGLCIIIGELIAYGAGYPFRMMWFTPLFSILMVFIISIVSAALSLSSVLKLDPASVFSGR